MKVWTIRIPDRWDARMKALADMDGRNVSEVARDCLARGLADMESQSQTFPDVREPEPQASVG